jgi:hypothetical protein
MTALTLAMVAGFAVGSDGQEGISTETDQRLCIGGNWEGSYQGTCPEWPGLEEQGLPLFIQDGFAFVETPPGQRPGPIYLLGEWIDEGNGRFRIDFWSMGTSFHGIYRRQGGRLSICMTAPSIQRPKAFIADQEHALLTLTPAKPPKK